MFSPYMVKYPVSSNKCPERLLKNQPLIKGHPFQNWYEEQIVKILPYDSILSQVGIVVLVRF